MASAGFSGLARRPPEKNHEQIQMPANQRTGSTQFNKPSFKHYTRNWYIRLKFKQMAKNTSILLGDYFDKFINQQVQSGKFSSASEVVRAALRMFEQEETKKVELIQELKRGEKSGFEKNFSRETFLHRVHQKHVSEK